MQVLDTKNVVRDRQHVIRTATVKDFGGGLNLSDDDLNINSRYAKVLKNMYRSRDGRLRIRYGLQLLASMPDSTTGNIIATEYYGGSLIVATSNGEIVRFPIGAFNAPTKLWPAAGKAPWSTGLVQVNFTQSLNELVIVNGVDKPLRLKSTFAIDYLGDAGNANSNINTPIAPYITACQNYVVMAGLPAFPTKLYISAKNATGTFSGDTAPNDATTFDVGGVVGHGDNKIVGLTALNNNLFVAFETSTIVLTLGNYSSATHVPTVFDVFDTYGAISQRSMTTVDRELWYCDQSGVLRVGRNQLSTAFIPDRVSQMIDPLLLVRLQTARAAGLIGSTFAVFNRLASQYMLFVPTDLNGTKETWVSTRYSPNDDPSWSLFNGLNFVAGTVSSVGKLYLSTARSLYVYGDVNNEIFSDNGLPIMFDWETPWSVFQEYDKIKKCKAVRVYSRGSADFTLSLFVDGIYKQGDNYNPTALIDFSGGDTGGFGNQTGDEPYGGLSSSVRQAADPRIWKFDGKFIQGKFRISGSAIYDLQIVGMSISYTVGGRKR